MNAPLFFTAIIAPSIVALITLYWSGRIRRREALFRWASNHGFKVLQFGQPVLSELSPFVFSGSKAQQIFRIKVQDTEGQTHSGWIRLGSIWRGLSSEKAEVRWD